MLTLPGKNFKQIALEAHKLLIQEHKAQDAINLLENYINQDEIDIGLIHWLALCYLEDKQYSRAKETYLCFDAFYQAGFCEVLLGNLNEAHLLWQQSPPSEVRYWSKCLETLLLGYIDFMPSFLGLRNHLEVDLGYLLKSNQLIFAENLLKQVDILVKINLECYKFAGRALLNNGFYDKSVNYFLKGQKLLPNDPEIYYHLGQYSLMVNAPKEAVAMFNHCLLISPFYTPAKDRLKEIEQKSGR